MKFLREKNKPSLKNIKKKNPKSLQGGEEQKCVTNVICKQKKILRKKKVNLGKEKKNKSKRAGW